MYTSKFLLTTFWVLFASKVENEEKKTFKSFLGLFSARFPFFLFSIFHFFLQFFKMKTNLSEWMYNTRWLEREREGLKAFVHGNFFSCIINHQICYAVLLCDFSHFYYYFFIYTHSFSTLYWDWVSYNSWVNGMIEGLMVLKEMLVFFAWKWQTFQGK